MPILKVVKFSDNVRYTFLHPFLTMKNPPLLIDFGMKCCILERNSRMKTTGSTGLVELSSRKWCNHGVMLLSREDQLSNADSRTEAGSEARGRIQ